MPAPSKAWVAIADTQVDADSPLDTTLVTGMRDDLVHLQEWLGYGKTPAQAHRHNGTDSERVTMADVSKTGAVGVFDDFTTAVSYGGMILSDHAWTILNTASVDTGSYGASGFVLLGPATADTLRHGISNLTTKSFKLSGGNTLTFEARVKLSGVVAGFYYFGLMDADDLTGNGVIFAADSGASPAAIKAKCMSAGALTQVITDLNWTINTTYKFKFVATASQVLFYVDDVLKATITTNIPTAAMAICLFIRGSVTACAVDYVDCTSSARV